MCRKELVEQTDPGQGRGFTKTFGSQAKKHETEPLEILNSTKYAACFILFWTKLQIAAREKSEIRCKANAIKGIVQLK